MNKTVLAIFLLLSCGMHVFAQPKSDSLLTALLENASSDIIHEVVKNKSQYRLQIIYTQINRDKHNKPVFRNFYFNYDSLLYFNPASTVKLPAAVLALQKLNEINRKDINKYTAIHFDSSYPAQTKSYNDTTSENGLTSIAHYIKRALLISENEPYNRLYQFLGQQYLNRELHKKGYAEARIVRQFMGFSEEGNRHTNPVYFTDKNGNIIYRQPPAYNTDSFDYSHSVKIGKAYLNSKDSLVNEPFDFTRHNNISLLSLQQILQSVMFPEAMPVNKRFNLSRDDYNFLRQYLSQYPGETNYPNYDSNAYYNSYVKFFFNDSSHRISSHIRIFNKVGWAYGFSTDVAYIADFKNNTEFMLAATLYVNSDEVLNDNQYEYETIALPFMHALGKLIYTYELNRKKKHLPKLDAFKINYEKKNIANKKTLIHSAAN